MRKYALVAILALTGTMTLAACNNGADDTAQQETQTAQVSKPADPNDSAAWGKYLSQVLSQNMQGMTADRPYPYLVPGGDSDEANEQRERQLDNVSTIISRGVTPGNLIALGGPDSSKTADFTVQALQNSQPGALKGVIILFIGDKADQQRVADAVKPTGAKLRFVEM